MGSPCAVTVGGAGYGLSGRPRKFVGVHQAVVVSYPSSVAGRVGDFQRAETYLARPEGRRAPGGTRCVPHGPGPAACLWADRRTGTRCSIPHHGLRTDPPPVT